MVPSPFTAGEGLLQKLRDAQVPRGDTEDGQHHQGRGHDQGLFPHVVGMMRIDPGFSPKSDEHQTKTIESRQTRREDTRHREGLTQCPRVPGGQQQCVFAEKSRGEGESGQRQ